MVTMVGHSLMAGLCLSLSVFFWGVGFASADVLQQISEKRDFIEQKSKAVDQEWERFQSELEVYQQRKNEVLLQTQREELKSQQLELQLSKLRELLKKDEQTHVQELSGLLEAIVPLQSLIEQGIEFRKVQRLEKLSTIRKLFEKKTTEPSYAAEVLWDFIAKEIRLGHSTEIANEEILLDGEKKLSRIVRLGLVQMLFKTETGEYGYGIRKNGKFSWVTAVPEERPLLEEAFQKFENGYVLGWFDLPLKALLFPEDLKISRNRIPGAWRQLFIGLMGESLLADPADQLLKQAMEREANLLNDQERMILRRQEKLSREKADSTSKAKSALRQEEKSLIERQSINEKLNQEVKDLGEEKSRLFGRQETLTKIWTRMMKSLNQNEAKYSLKPIDEIVLPPAPEDIKVSDLKEAWQRSIELLKQLSAIEVVEVEVNSGKGVERMSALRWGGLGIFSGDREKIKEVLGPGKDQELTKLNETIQGKQGLGIFLFDGLGGGVLIKKHQTWLDRVADQVPLLILGFMLLVVLFIFTKLARA